VCVCVCVCVHMCVWWWAVVKRVSRRSLCTSATARPKASSQLAHMTPRTTAHVLVRVVLISHIVHAGSYATQPSPVPHTMHTLLIACTHAHVRVKNSTFYILHTTAFLILRLMHLTPHWPPNTQSAMAGCNTPWPHLVHINTAEWRNGQSIHDLLSASWSLCQAVPAMQHVLSHTQR
jgi:hypothetical protein